MSIFSFFSNTSTSGAEIPEIFPLSLKETDFKNNDVINTYNNILTDVIDRSFGIPKKYDHLLWDSATQSESSKGLITLIAEAMAYKRQLFLVFKSNVIRKATMAEEKVIRKDYKEKSESSEGLFISFENYKRSDMLYIYSALEYCVLASLNKTLNISKALQIKIKSLRAGVSLNDSAIAEKHAKEIAVALGNGNDVLIDSKDDIMTAKPDTSSTDKSIQFLDQKRAKVLQLPLSYISGIKGAGFGDSGSADAKAIDRGLKQYFVSIIRPILNSLFNIDIKFKSQDVSNLDTALEVLKSFELVSNENISTDSKREIISRLFDLDILEEKRKIQKEERELQNQNTGLENTNNIQETEVD